MTGPATFHAQRRIGEELLAHGWHASAIATRTTPGSAWALIDPSRRIRVRMGADFAAPRATLAATALPGAPDTAPAWSLIIDFAPSTTVVAAALAAAAHPDAVTRRRTLIRALESSGMRPDRSRFRRAFTGGCIWRTDDGRARAVWTAPRRGVNGTWRIATATLRMDATATTPAAVLAAILSASTSGNEATL